MTKAIFLVLLSMVFVFSDGCRKKIPAVVPLKSVPPVQAPLPTGRTAEPAKATPTLPCDARLQQFQHTFKGQQFTIPCDTTQLLVYPNMLLKFPNQEPLTEQNFPAKCNEAGFVYDGGNVVFLLYNDCVHLWILPMILFGNSQ